MDYDSKEYSASIAADNVYVKIVPTASLAFADFKGGVNAFQFIFRFTS